jgi:hypothetical protein
MSSLWGHLVTSCNAEFLEHLKDRGISSVNCNIHNLNIVRLNLRSEFEEIQLKINNLQSQNLTEELVYDLEFLEAYSTLKTSNIKQLEDFLLQCDSL